MEKDFNSDKTTRVGFVAADATGKAFDSGNQVTNVTIISGTGENTQTTYVRGWNAMADKLKDIKKGEKWEFKGSVSQESNNGYTNEVMNAKEAYQHVKMEIKGVVKHIENKKLGRSDMTNIMVVNSEMKGGREVSEVYNIELYGEKNMEKGKDIQVGDIVSTKGHVRMYDYVKKGETKINKAFQNPLEIKNHTKRRNVELDTPAGENVVKEPKTENKTVKSKRKGKALQI